MTPSGAKKAALAAGTAAGTMAVLDAATSARWPRLRVAIGAGIVIATLTALAEPLPDIAGGFALLILIAALLGTGARVLPRVVNYFQ